MDEAAFTGLIRRLAEAQVDSITAVGSIGSYAYLSTEEHHQVTHLAVGHAGGLPVFVGIGALRTSHVLTHLKDAQQAGASAVLLAPMTYQPLTDDDVFPLFRTVTTHSSVPVIAYDNPGTTHFTFTTELYGRIAQLPGIASIKIPAVPADPQQARARVSGSSRRLPAIAGPARHSQRRAQSWDVASYGLSGTLGPAAVAWIAATAGPSPRHWPSPQPP